MTKYIVIIAVFLIVCVLMWQAIPHRQSPAVTKNVVALFTQDAIAFQHSVDRLSEHLHGMTVDTSSVLAARAALADCRLNYKRISYFTGFYFPDQALLLNGPPVPEVETGMNEYRDPTGLQVIESILFAKDPFTHKNEMLDQVTLMQRSTQHLLSLMSTFRSSTGDLWYALSLEFIRVYTLYITGYDAPQLKTGIREAVESVESIGSILSLINTDKDLVLRVNETVNYLSDHQEFDTFDRLYFLLNYALPLQQLLNAHISRTPDNLSMRSAVNFKASSLFASNGLNGDFFPGAPDSIDHALVALGHRLFSERRLSSNNDRSCATCHSPLLYFSDRLRRNKNRELTGDLPRNTPSLFYAAYQFHQFWDGRVRTLADQALTVMNDTLEMNGPGHQIAVSLMQDTSYRSQFQKIWPGQTTVTDTHIASALAAYVRTLAPFQSSFDRYINGDQSALSGAQQRGFNLFMGKALCGTCHFAPLFNGLLPPLYNTTEFEVPGTPLNDNFTSVKADPDTGRARTVASLPRGAFKTPTVRNAAATAPYMHNGGFKTLESVIAFYDKGGGQGLGLPAEGQTLSAQPLRLDSSEKADLLAFIQSLTDQ